MADIQLAIEGEAAIEATESLLQIPGISGTWETNSEPEREGTLATIATIIGIVGGTIAIAEQIRKWYEEYSKSKKGKKIEKVLIVTPQGRFLMENATTDEIAKALEQLSVAK
jgi:hypothetical protein